MPNLLIRDADGCESRHSLERTTLFGRDPDCDLVLLGDGVSRRHGRFVRDDLGNWWVEDLGSKNGILLGSQPLKRHHLVHGDVLHIGAVTIRILEASLHQGDSGAGQITLMREPGNLQTTVEHEPVRPEAIADGRLALLYNISRQLLDQKDVSGLIDTTCSALIKALDATVVVTGLTCHPEQHRELLFVRPKATTPAEVTLSLSVLKRTINAVSLYWLPTPVRMFLSR